MITETPTNNEIQSKDKVLDFALDQIKHFNEENTPPEWRNSLKVCVAGILALSLWIFMGWLARAQFISSKDYGNRISEIKLPDEKYKLDLYEKASNKVQDTAKSLFTIVGPITTAVTGYFFVSVGSPSNKAITSSKQNDLVKKKNEEDSQNIESGDV